MRHHLDTKLFRPPALSATWIEWLKNMISKGTYLNMRQYALGYEKG
jgi:hypothetical protein